MNIIPRTEVQAKNVFIVSHKDDQGLKKELCDHLKQLQREEKIAIVEPGEPYMPWPNIILILVSPSLAGDGDLLTKVDSYGSIFYNARIIPIRIREVRMPKSLAELQYYPHNGSAIAELSGRDRGWAQVEAGIRQVVEELSYAE